MISLKCRPPRKTGVDRPGFGRSRSLKARRLLARIEARPMLRHRVTPRPEGLHARGASALLPARVSAVSSRRAALRTQPAAGLDRLIRFGSPPVFPPGPLPTLLSNRHAAVSESSNNAADRRNSGRSSPRLRLFLRRPERRLGPRRVIVPPPGLRPFGRRRPRRQRHVSRALPSGRGPPSSLRLRARPTETWFGTFLRSSPTLARGVASSWWVGRTAPPITSSPGSDHVGWAALAVVEEWAAHRPELSPPLAVPGLLPPRPYGRIGLPCWANSRWSLTRWSNLPAGEPVGRGRAVLHAPSLAESRAKLVLRGSRPRPPLGPRPSR